MAFASQSLALVEKGYAQLDTEALTIIFGVKEFNQYLLGQSFTIISDQKTLQYILSKGKPVRTLASTRIKRQAIILGAYEYKIECKPGDKHSNADALNHLPLCESIGKIPTPGATIMLLVTLHHSLMDAKQIQLWID